MKKRKIAICATIAATLAVSPALCACSGDNYSEISFAKQDTSYVVTSQGGSAVSYGNYVYFINGTRGYEDAKGKSNVWDSVVKGGLYRAEYNGKKVKAEGDAYAHFERTLDTTAGLEFKYTESKDYFDEPINVVDVTKIAPKTIGTSGYAQGGVFIYDSYVYFASPNAEKSNTGKVQTNRTDFFMMPLSGGKPTRVYTTPEGVNTSSSAYAFYKYKGAVYLVVNEGSNIVSVRINVGDAEADDPVTFKVKATSVYFPVRDTYYKGIDNNTVEDFIYFVRAVTDKDGQKSGTVIEAMRPDGKENFVVSNAGKTETIEAVRDGLVFWRSTTELDETVIRYDNLHEQLMDHSPSYKKAQEKLLADEATADSANRKVSGSFETNITSTITSTYAFRPASGALSNEAYFVGVTGSLLSVYSVDGTSRTVYSGTTGTPLFIKENYLYYSGAESDYYRVALFENMDDYGKEPQKIAESTTAAGISCDYVDGYFTYFAEVDEWANGYTFFSKVDGYEGLEPQFVGKRAKSDIPSKKEIESAKGETSED